jgi:hypothetical protein
MKTSLPRSHLAILNNQTLQSLRTQHAQAAPTNPRLPGGIRVSNLQSLIRPSSDQLLIQAIAHIKHPGLQRLLSAVLSEPEAQLALLTPYPESAKPRSWAPRFPVETLRRGAELASFWCVLCQDERDVLYVATFIKGLSSLLLPFVVGTANLDDILFTLVRPALHRLDHSSPAQGQLLRLALGWGNADEVDSGYAPAMVEAIKRALLAVGM